MEHKREWYVDETIGGKTYTIKYNVYFYEDSVRKFTRQTRPQYGDTYTDEQRIPQEDVPDDALETWADNIMSCAEEL